MTDTLALAGALRTWDEDRLRALVTLRQVPDDAAVDDLFDLAEYLLDRARLEAVVRRLDRRVLIVLAAAAELNRPFALEELVALVSRHGGDTAGWDEEVLTEARSTAIASALLLDEDLDVPIAAVGAALAAVVPPLALASLLREDRPRTLAAADDPTAVAAISAERAFLASARTGDLLDALLRHPARELGRGGLSLPDARNLSTIIGTDVEAVGPLMELASAARLVSLEDRSWLVTTVGLDWLGLRIADRWRVLADSWRSGISPEILSIMSSTRHGHLGDRLEAFARWWFPAGGDWLTGRIDQLAARSDILGLTVDGAWSPSAVALLTDGVDAASETLAPSLPEEVDKVYIQNDLTIIAPGPLLPELDRTLRGLADLESRSHASTYRVSPASVGRALSHGTNREAILDFLRGISLTGLPQPVEYVVSEAAARHGLIRVGPFSRHDGSNAASSSTIRSTDQDYLDAIRVDQSLAPLALSPSTRSDGRGGLESRFAPDVVFWALQGARYPVAAETAEGTIVQLAREHLAGGTEPARSNSDALVRRLVESTGEDGEATDAAWLARQLDEAVKRRSTITIVVNFPDGLEREFTIEATGLSGGRLRGRDANADVERTVPVRSIASVRPA
ncbi:helicase-associated domain-containing protein [Labedella endophytica]|uniref:Helicase XPB/Ssl2 N-terminal domain-containing protein n=1 Tax=Labedella endophytica TaxID=1523160 RepID=A0A433JQS8_9MICO|nr:helicase-associated domain-containing protein [Labedella endophytica]RUQ99036.1 hypothetical protein ELQ94_12000 [Labedella endophytica]